MPRNSLVCLNPVFQILVISLTLLERMLMENKNSNKVAGLSVEDDWLYIHVMVL